MTIETPPPTATSSRLERPRRRKIAGVCTGLAAAYSRPLWLVRLAFIALACVCVGVIAYVLLWLTIPAEGDPASLAEQAWQERHEHPLRLAAFGLIVLGLIDRQATATIAVVAGVVLLLVWRRQQKQAAGGN